MRTTLHVAGLLGSGDNLSPDKNAIQGSQMVPEFRAAAEALQKQLEGKPKDDRKKFLADVKVSDQDLYQAYVALVNEGKAERRREIDQKMGKVYQIQEYSDAFHASIAQAMDQKGAAALKQIKGLLPHGSNGHHGRHHGSHKKSA
jgi:hypothetical protein